MGRALTIFFGLLAFGLLVLFCLGHEEHIEKEVATNAKSALTAGGYGFARATAEGQTVILRGTAETAVERDAAERAVLAAPGVIDVDNQIALLTDVPPPGPDSRPVLVGETEDPTLFIPSPAPDPSAVAPQEPSAVEPIPESLQLVLDRSTRQAEVVGLALAAEVDDERAAQINEQIEAALPDWQVSSELSATASVPTDLMAAIQLVLPTLLVAEQAQLDVDSQGIRVDARLASFADRAALQTTLDGLSVQDELVDSNLSWMLDSPPPNVDSCQQAFDDLLGKDTIMFTTNRAEIRPGSIDLLDKLVDIAGDCNVTIEIEGHTDSRGTAELNNYLSQARADSVRTYLIDNGVNASQISARGFGSSKPIADNNTVNGRQANRRIEFRVQRTEP